MERREEMPPLAEADPRETLQWVRRWEVISGIAALGVPARP